MDYSAYPLTIYYESACALCSSEITNLKLRDTRGLLKFVDISDPAFGDLPARTTLQDLLDLIHAVKPDGTVIRGVEVFRLAYAAVDLDWIRRALDLPLIESIALRGYPWIARNRHRLPAWLIRLVFETGWRRAAVRTAGQRRAPGRACDI